MYPRNLEALLSSGEANVRNYITTGCFEWLNSEPVEKHIQNHDHQRVHQVLDYLLHENIKPEELALWIKCLFSGRLNPSKFLQEVKKYNKTCKCGIVWTDYFVAYRCRTCAISLCMSLCADCFLNGNHEGHDFNMFLSHAGGACDCGDNSVMKEEGFCKNHRSKPQQSTSNKNSLPPNSLLCITREIMPKLLYHLVLALRENRKFEDNAKLNCLLDEIFVVLSDLGTVMQEILGDTLTDENLYRTFFKNTSQIGSSTNAGLTNQNDFALQHRLKIIEENYKSVKNEISLKAIFPDQPLPIVLNHEEITSKISAFDPDLEHVNFLDEIIFWTAMYEYPSNLITFLLKMLPNEKYKLKFSESFLKHYFKLSMLIFYSTHRFGSNNRDISYNKLAHALVHVSVQLFSNENLVLYLCDNANLFEIIILTIKYALEGNQKNFWGIMVPNLLFQNENDFPPRVFSCRHPIMVYNRFWPITSDLGNLLTHEQLVFKFLNDDRLIDLWLEFIMGFQGMNCNRKAEFVENENSDFKAAYLAELEVPVNFMWGLIVHLKDSKTKQITINFTKRILKWLKTWIGFTKKFTKINIKKIDVTKCSFHFPLHRYFSVFLQHAITVQGANVEDVIPIDHDLFKSFIYHPLQTITVYNHINADVWKYNGIQIRTQAHNYVQAPFCNSTIDPDFFLIQLAAIYLDCEEFIDICASINDLNVLLHIRPLNSESLDDKVDIFLENAFTFFAYLVTQRISLGMSNEDVTRKEMIALLSLDQKSHSQIQDTLPSKHGFPLQTSIIETLNDIADYKQPEVEASGGLVQGSFILKSRVWDLEYDPLYVLYRTVNRRDFQTSMQRFSIFARPNGKQYSSTELWPPFRIPSDPLPAFRNPQNILKSRTLQAYYFSILMNALNNINYISHHLLSIVIYLIELTIIEANKTSNDKDWSNYILDKRIVPCMLEGDYQNWFITNDIIDNFLVEFQQYRMKDNQSLSSSMVLDIFNSVFENYLTPEDHTELIEQMLNARQCNADYEIVSDDPSVSAVSTQDNEYQQYLIDLNDEDTDSDEDTNQVCSDDNISEMNHSFTNNNNCSNNSRKKSDQNDRMNEFSINESFLTILLKLYSKFSGKKDAFKTTISFLEQFDFESRYGDGQYFIGCLLKRFILTLSKRIELKNNPDSFETSKKSIEIVLNFVEDERRKIWPKKFENSVNSTNESKHYLEREKSHESDNMELDPETIQKMEKKRMAQELRNKILNKFKNIQTNFEKHIGKEAMDTEGNTSNASSETDSTTNPGTSSNNNSGPEVLSYRPPTYECAICGDSGHSKLERSFVQITHLQSTSILGNAPARTVFEEFENNETTSFDKRNISNSLPLSDDDVREMNTKRRLYRDSFDSMIEIYSSTFSKPSWLSAFNIGWCGGIHVQSCGHYMHLDCFQSYVSRMRNDHDTLFEFLCPLCRKIGNSVSPIIPNFANLYALVKSRSNRNSPQLTNEIWNLLSNSDTSRLANTTHDESQFLKVFSTAMEDLMRATDPEYRNISVSPCPESLFLYLLSISRINVECMIIMWRESLLKGHQTRSCFVNLFQALSLNAKLVLPMHFTMLWSQITGILPENETKNEMLIFTKEVPILLKDCSALLLQLLYALPFNIDKAYFLTITQALLNLNFIQALLLVSYHMPREQRRSVKSRILLIEDHNRSRPVFSTFFDYIAFMMNSINPNSFMDFTTFQESKEPLSEKQMLDMIVKLCLPFMRMASMLFYMLYDETLPDYKTINPQSDPIDEFANLARFLTLNRQDSLEVEEFTHDESFFRPFLNWVINDPSPLIHRWYEEYEKSIHFSSHATKAILKEKFMITGRPRLLNLPRVYEQIFLFYHKRTCDRCKKVSKEPAICLVCGKMVCIRDCCCRVDNVLEGVGHSRICGARTAIYLAVNSSLICVIRGLKACVWGSVYLDEFGEEDRDLKRGKPLYLSIERYRLLEQQWLSHTFPFVNKKWFEHKDLA